MTAIPNETMAFVEYIKNSYDAYVRGGLESKTEIHIDIGVNIAERFIYCLDHASGMTATELVSNFSQVGSHTGGDTGDVNALFSKGSTDTTALGTVTYTTIKNGKISSCCITYDDIFTPYMTDVDVTPGDRIKYKIPLNGTYVQLDFLDTYIIRPYGNIKMVYKYFSLKSIVEHVQSKIVFSYTDGAGDIIDDKTLLKLDAIQIKTTLVKDEKILIPGWVTNSGGAVYSYFSLYLATENIDTFSTDDKYKRSGVFIDYNNVIIDRSMFDRALDTIPISRKIFGTLRCDFIFELLMRYDAGVPDPKNTKPLIEPNRLTGLNKYHPFVADLFKVPREQLKYIIEDLDAKESSFDENASLTIDNLFNMLGNWHSAVLYEMREFLYSYGKTKTLSNYNTLVKLQDNIVNDASSKSAYNFKNVEEIKKMENGNINPEFPAVVLTFIHDTSSVYPYIMYGINSRIQINLNVTDYLLSKCVLYDAEKKSYNITNSQELSVTLVHYLTEAISREVFKVMDSKMNEGDVVERNSNDSFNKLFAFRPSLHMAMYTVLITNGKLNELLTNES
jgi:hypothetical protein